MLGNPTPTKIDIFTTFNKSIPPGSDENSEMSHWQDRLQKTAGTSNSWLSFNPSQQKPAGKK